MQSSSSTSSSSFQPVNRVRKYTSYVWNFFHREIPSTPATSTEAKCSLCAKKLKITGSSTSGLRGHLSSCHQITKENYITKGHILLNMSTSEIISRVVSEGLLNFNQLSGDVIRAVFALAGFSIPSHPSNINKYFMKEYELSFTAVKLIFAKEISNGTRFSLTVDESTSVRGRRYMNINAHKKSSHYCLRMKRVIGSITSEVASGLVEERLADFGLNWSHVSSVTTDGASNMVKMGENIPPLHQLCLLHGIHLALKDTLYTAEYVEPIMFEIVQDGEELEGEDLYVEGDVLDVEGAAEWFEGEVEDGSVEFYSHVFASSQLKRKWTAIIASIRSIVKYFKVSPVRNEKELQPHVLQEFNKHLSLVLDCPGKWNSLCKMLENFLKMLSCLRLSFSTKDKAFPLSVAEVTEVEHMVRALQPIEQLCSMLGREDAGVVEADQLIKCTTEMLLQQETAVAHEVKRNLMKRYLERRNTPLVHLLSFLNSSSYLQQSVDAFGFEIRWFEIRKLAEDLNERIFPLSDESEASSSSDAVPDTSSEDQPRASTPTANYTPSLQQFYKTWLSRQTQNDVTSPPTLSSLLSVYVSSNVLSPQLVALKKVLDAVKATSIECERSFSLLERLVTKGRSRLEDRTVDALVFQRKFFTNHKPYVKDFK